VLKNAQNWAIGVPIPATSLEPARTRNRQGTLGERHERACQGAGPHSILMQDGRPTVPKPGIAGAPPGTLLLRWRSFVEDVLGVCRTGVSDQIFKRTSRDYAGPGRLRGEDGSAVTAARSQALLLTIMTAIITMTIGEKSATQPVLLKPPPMAVATPPKKQLAGCVTILLHRVCSAE